MAIRNIGGEKVAVMALEHKPEASKPLATQKAAKLVPFCKRYDAIKADYAGGAEKVRHLRKLAHDAVQAIERVNEYSIKRSSLDAVAARGIRVKIDNFRTVDEREPLASVEQANADCEDLGLGAILCRKSGARIGEVSTDQRQILATLMKEEQDAMRYGEKPLQDALLLSVHGVSPSWVSTAPETLEKLRGIDPAGYTVYMLAAWQHGELIAKSLANLQQRADAYATLSSDPDIMEKAGIVETLCKVYHGVKDARLTLSDIAALSLDDLNKQAASFLTRLVHATNTQMKQEKKRISLSVFNRLSANVPTPLRAIKRAKSPFVSVEASETFVIAAQTFAGAMDGLDFDTLGVVSHETTLEGDNFDIENLDMILEAQDDELRDDELWLENTLSGIPEEIELIGSRHMANVQSGGSSDSLKWREDNLDPTITGDVFDDVFDALGEE